ncbi:MAG TPA: ABC transporter substrate-binding protein [Pseudonocardia sp.]|nr:ABC transporter substrate-binding protein [Pseudonocardia sp.]
MRNGRWGGRRRITAAVALVAALVVAGCSGQETTPSTGRPVRGGIATYALPANTDPNYIFPFMATQYVTVVNVGALQYHLFRPLYWFGDQGRPVFNQALSLAEPPTFADNNRTVTVTLKDYNWSDGTKVSADNVVFWINMAKAQKANLGYYVPGGIPDDVDSVTADSPTQVTFRLNKTYSQNWFLYNELATITPMPKAWDRDAAGPRDCSHKVSDCTAVYEYLADQAKSLNDYATNPLWQVVDGPWKLKSYNADGNISFVPNQSYSGPIKPKLDEFRVAPFANNAAEYNVLRSGNNAIQFGYLPPESAPVREEGQAVGHNPLAGNYSIYRWQSLSINYFAINQHNPKVGPIFRQTYFRQALESLIDQRSIIKAAAHGYGVPTDGPVPAIAAPPGDQVNPFTYDPMRAQKLLADHGWSTPYDGVGVCERPGAGPDQCGPDVPAGARLEFTMLYSSGIPRLALTVQQIQSSASKIGFRLNLRGAPFHTVTGTAIPCKTGAPDCNWEMGNWGGGWVFAPAYYPTGEQIFASGAGNNQANFSDPELDKRIAATTQSDSPEAMREYMRYGSETLPGIWQPNFDYAVVALANNLKGVLPLNPFLTINPEDWYYVK